MRIVFGLVLVLGLALAGFAVYMAQAYIGQTQAALERERAARGQAVPTVKVYVANRDLRYGERLTEGDLAMIDWPQNAIPAGAFGMIENLFPEDRPRFRTVLRPMQQFEPILAAKITEPGEDAGLTSRLARGMRAFAIKVDVTSGVSGFLRPGDRVDVYWTGSAAGVGDVTKLIETGVRLIAVDQSAAIDGSGSALIARTVTVEVTPQQVAALAQAQATGRLSLSLVGAEDDAVAEAVEVDMRRLLGIEERRVEAAPEERVCTVRTRRGAEWVDIPIACTN
jgi:pilus assembly protein CpaB